MINAGNFPSGVAKQRRLPRKGGELETERKAHGEELVSSAREAVKISRGRSKQAKRIDVDLVDLAGMRKVISKSPKTMQAALEHT